MPCLDLTDRLESNMAAQVVQRQSLMYFGAPKTLAKRRAILTGGSARLVAANGPHFRNHGHARANRFRELRPLAHTAHQLAKVFHDEVSEHQLNFRGALNDADAIIDNVDKLL